MKITFTLTLLLISLSLFSQVVYNSVDKTYLTKASDMARIEFLLREGIACDSANILAGREIDLLANELNFQYGTIDSLLLEYQKVEKQNLDYVNRMVRMDEQRDKQEKALRREKRWGWVFKGATIILSILTLAIK